MSAVRTQQRLVGLDLVVRLVQQRQVQTDAQQRTAPPQQRPGAGPAAASAESGRRRPGPAPRTSPAPQCEAHQGARTSLGMLMLLARRPGEPQRGADQSAGRSGGQRHCHARMPASTTGRPSGRLCHQPVENCGASRVIVAAAVKMSAPTLQSRSRPRLLAWAVAAAAPQRGHEHQDQPAKRHPEPVAHHPDPPRPIAQRTPYERATIAPVRGAHPTPSPMPSAAVSTSMGVGMSRKPSDSRDRAGTATEGRVPRR